MTLRSNAAEAWYADRQPGDAQAGDRPSLGESSEIPLDLLPPVELSRPLWRSLVGNLRDTVAPEKLPPLQLTSRPIDVGLLLGDRLRLAWFRTVFTNIGDFISPETLPPLELESTPVDVGELLTDRLSHFWWGSLLRNLADRVAPESLPSLNLTAKPIPDVVPKSWLLLPLWSEVVEGPKIFYPDKPKAAEVPRAAGAKPAAASEPAPQAMPPDPSAAALLRDIRRSKIRQRIWIGLATAQAAYLIAAAIWPSIF